MMEIMLSKSIEFRSAVSDCAWGVGVAAPQTPYSIKFKACLDHHYTPPIYATGAPMMTMSLGSHSLGHLSLIAVVFPALASSALEIICVL